jgi:sterol desaturase/sphingolipid hydroxylase (fatty acid hydroxylase superfamily)
MAIAGYWGMAIISTTLDLLPALFLKYKAQGNRSYFTVREWLGAVGVSMANLNLVAPYVMIPMFSNAACKDGWLPNPLTEADPWDWKIELPKVLVCTLVVDFWFYWTHRLIHHPGEGSPFLATIYSMYTTIYTTRSTATWLLTTNHNARSSITWAALYKHIHKFHHRFKAPTAVASMYANPIEFAIGNQLGVVLGPWLSRAHPYTAYFWLCFALFGTGGSHSGYLFFECETHDWHHEHFDYQFGVAGMWDAICGTGFEGSKKWERVMAKKGKKGSTVREEPVEVSSKNS